MIEILKKSQCLFFVLLPLNFFAAPLNLTVDAESAILINAENGKVLFEKNAQQVMYPASLTKVATALYILQHPNLNLDDKVSIQEDHVKIVSPQLKKQSPELHPSYRLEYGSIVAGLRAQEEVPLRRLLYALLLASGNDAANALAAHFHANIPEFMENVNAYLRLNQVCNTTFNNPHGLHHDEHLSTAYDLAKMTALALKNPIFREVVRTKKFPKTEGSDGTELYFTQTNRLLKPGKFYYPKAIGVKTGSTSKAGFNLIAAAEDKGRELIAVVLKCKDSESRYRDAINLFEAAFKEAKINRVLLAKGHDIFKKEMAQAKLPLEAVLRDDVTLSYYPSEEPTLKAHLLWKELKLPIQEGDLVGEMQIVAEDGSLLTKAPVFAVNTVEMTSWAKLRTWVFEKRALLLEHKLLIIFSLTLLVLLLALFLKREQTSQPS